MSNPHRNADGPVSTPKYMNGVVISIIYGI